MPQVEKRGLIQFNAAEKVLAACRGKEGEYNRELPLTLTLHEDGTCQLSNGDESVVAPVTWVGERSAD